MLFAIGTKVKLQHTGDLGLIREILSDGMLKIRLDSGFEIPVHQDDLISLAETIRIEKKTVSPHPVSNESPRIQYTILKSKGIQLAFEPKKNRTGVTQSFDVYLINDTRYDFSFDLELSFLNDNPIAFEDLLKATSIMKIGSMRYDQLNDHPQVDIEGQQLRKKDRRPFCLREKKFA